MVYQLRRASIVSFRPSFLAVLMAISILTATSLVRADELEPFCDPMAGLLSHDFSPTRLSDISKAGEAARANAETSPFANACQDPKLFKDRPPTGLFRRSVPLFDSSGRSSAELLKRIGTRVIDSMSNEELRLSVMEECLSGKIARTSTACRDVRLKIDTEILPTVNAARMNLALAQTDAQIRTTVLQKVDLRANTSLNSLGTQKESSWQPLEAADAKKASRILDEYFAEMKTEALRRVAAGQLPKQDSETFVNDAVFAARFTHGLKYVELLSRNPLLQYLTTAKPSDAEIMQAIQKMRKHLASDRAYAEKALRAAEEKFAYGSVRGVRYKSGPLKEINPDALPILDFTSHVESILQASPEFCGLAASLQYTKENRSLGNGLAIGVPLIVVSLALPVLGQAMAGVVIGGVSGVGYAVSSKFDRDDAASRFISKLNVDSAEDYRKLDQADRDFKISLALGPAMAVAGPGIRSVTVGLRATRFGAWIAEKSLKAGKITSETVEAAGTNVKDAVPK